MRHADSITDNSDRSLLMPTAPTPTLSRTLGGTAECDGAPSGPTCCERLLPTPHARKLFSLSAAAGSVRLERDASPMRIPIASAQPPRGITAPLRPPEPRRGWRPKISRTSGGRPSSPAGVFYPHDKVNAFRPNSGANRLVGWGSTRFDVHRQSEQRAGIASARPARSFSCSPSPTLPASGRAPGLW